MQTLDELFDLTITSRYGENINSEILAETILSLITPEKSLPYYREYGSQLKREEGKPLTINSLIKYTINLYKVVQRYNDDLTSIEERRISVLPDEVQFDDANRAIGDIGMYIGYTAFRDIDSGKNEYIKI